jgi:hypothetical protein
MDNPKDSNQKTSKTQKQGQGAPEPRDGAPWTQQPAAPADAQTPVDAQRNPDNRVVPTGGQVEPSAQLKAVPIGYNPPRPNRPRLTLHRLQSRGEIGMSKPASTLKESNIYSNKGVLWALLSVPA